VEKIPVQYKVALKLPHGKAYLNFDGDKFVSNTNVEDWIMTLYKGKHFTNYINYNDEHDDKISAIGGHCKGCVAWNDTEICWLIHSVPKFIIRFNDGTIDTDNASIYDSELIYGHSFVFVSGLSVSQLPLITQQLSIMKPFIVNNSSNYTLPSLSAEVMATLQLSSVQLTENPVIYHIAKSPKNHIDLFSEMIQPAFHGKWQCETWIRGHMCPYDPYVIDNKNIMFDSIVYSSSHDHSKYACNDIDLVYIGDLNRMTTQYWHGGGGFIIQDTNLNLAIRSIMDT
jgi:hypothetical protein